MKPRSSHARAGGCLMNIAHMQTTRSLQDSSREHWSPPHGRSVACKSSQWGHICTTALQPMFQVRSLHRSNQHENTGWGRVLVERCSRMCEAPVCTPSTTGRKHTPHTTLSMDTSSHPELASAPGRGVSSIHLLSRPVEADSGLQ